VAQVREIKAFISEMFAPFFLSERSRYVGMAVFAVVALLLVYTVITALSGWYGDFKTPPATPADTHLASMNTELQLITDLPKQHLFGAAEGDDAFLPITSLQLRLIGISKDTNDKFSRVIVAEGDQPGKVYAIGDSLLSGIAINAINDDGIVLEHSGRLEKLLLTREPLSFKEAPKTLWDN
jgi:type II secretory pathway component PulC